MNQRNASTNNAYFSKQYNKPTTYKKTITTINSVLPVVIIFTGIYYMIKYRNYKE